MKRLITKSIIRNRFGLLETTDKLGPKHKFFATRKQAADFLRRLHSFRLYINALEDRRINTMIHLSLSISDQAALRGN